MMQISMPFFRARSTTAVRSSSAREKSASNLPLAAPPKSSRSGLYRSTYSAKCSGSR